MRSGVLEKDYQGVAYSTQRAPNELPDQPTGNRPLDRAELAALRGAAARLERPKAGLFLRVTEDGRAIATGQKGQRIPQPFVRFAEDNDLTLTAERRLPKYDRTTPTSSGGNVTPRSEPMPIEYRENGAMYFGEMGGEALDRTGMSRFSTRREALLDMPPVDVAFDASGSFGDAKLRARAAYIKLQKATQDNGYGAVTTDGKRVKFSMAGFKEATHHAADRRVLASISNAKTLVESALPMYSEAPATPEQGVRRYHYYATKVRFNDSDDAFALVEIKETTNGEWFYDTDATDVETARAIYSAALANQTKSGAGDTEHTALKGRLAKWFAGVNDPIVKKSTHRITIDGISRPTPGGHPKSPIDGHFKIPQ